MALFPLKKIAALCGRQTYLRGVALYGAGAVSDLVCRPDEAFADRLTARVADRHAGGEYGVQVGFNAAGEAVFFACGCSSRESGACRHVAAALVHKYYRDMVAEMPAALPETPPAHPVTGQMLDRYDREARLQMQARAAAPVALVPALELEAMPFLTLSLRTAEGHGYVIKDLREFAARMESCETYSYGARLTLLHHPDALTPESRPLLGLLEAGAALGGNPRRLPLTPGLLDRLFALYEGKELTVCGRPVPCLSADPPLEIEVTGEGEGAALEVARSRFAMGCERLYWLGERALYAASPGCTAAVRGLLSALRQSGGRLPLSGAELARFAAGVLPAAETYIAFTGEAALFDPYRPLPLAAAVYLDMPDPGLLTARVEFRYGEALYGPEEEGETGRDRLAEWRVMLAVTAAFPRRTPEGLYAATHTEESLYDFLTDGLPALARVATVYMSDSFKTLRVAPPPPVSVGVRLNNGLLELTFDGDALDREELAELMESYRARKRYHRLRSGEFLSLESGSLQGLARLGEGLGLTDRQLRRGRATVPAYRAPFVDAVLRESRSGYTRDEAVGALLAAVKTVADSEFTPPDTLVGTLRGYQRTGFRWLRTMETYGFGGILADDMGLGKTVQMIALLLDAAARGITLPSLVVCPASLVLNWESELHRFAPSLPVRVVVGDGPARASLLEQVAPGEVVITSYDLLKRDLSLYEGLQFHYQVLDEAQYIKNHTTQNARAAKAVRSVQRFALTGTPIENRLSELWSIFDFLMPGFLFSYPRFRERFEQPAVRDGDKEALEALSRLCAPFLLRRLKKEVLQELPPKTETVYRIPLGDTQRRTYMGAALRMREELKAAPGSPTRLQALTMLTRLRQICCDPSLCFDNYKGGSAKLESCLALTREAVEAGHRVLIFSQFTSMLAVIRERLQGEGIPFYLLQGSTPREKRAAMVADFNAEGEVPVFLISLKAGGTGLNLTAADVVIHYDPWWNLSVQNQATDRAHRIGQQRPVQVYKLIAEGTVEEKILALQQGKQSLAEAVVRADETALTSLTDKELLELLMG